MKIQCHLCKEIVKIGAFALAVDGIEIHCWSCEQSFFLSKEGNAKAQADAGKPEPSELVVGQESSLGLSSDKPCPKCGEPVPETARACVDCGLMRSRFAQYAAEAPDSDPELETLWKECRDNWNDQTVHDQFAAHASQSGAFAQAARCYREFSKTSDNAALAEIATTRLARITKMAEVALLAKKPVAADEPGAGHYRGVVILLVLMLMVGAAAGVYTLTKKKGPHSNGKITPVTRPAR